MKIKEELSRTYALAQCEVDCQLERPGCEETCEEYNVFRLDFIAGYDSAVLNVFGCLKN